MGTSFLRDGRDMDLEELSKRLAGVRSGSQRFYDRDFLGRAWLAEYVAHVDMVMDWVEHYVAEVRR